MQTVRNPTQRAAIYTRVQVDVPAIQLVTGTAEQKDLILALPAIGNVLATASAPATQDAMVAIPVIRVTDVIQGARLAIATTDAMVRRPRAHRVIRLVTANQLRVDVTARPVIRKQLYVPATS